MKRIFKVICLDGRSIGRTKIKSLSTNHQFGSRKNERAISMLGSLNRFMSCAMVNNDQVSIK